MTIHITPGIQAAYRAYLDEQVDSFANGVPLLRRNTYPYNEHGENCGLVDFAAGYQAADGVTAACDAAQQQGKGGCA